MACRLLCPPAELRLSIWEYAFAPKDDADIDLLDTSPPTKALLLTCRQVCAEAFDLYKQAYRAYWSSTFLLSADVPLDRAILPAELSRIQHLVLIDPKDVKFKAAYYNGLWIDPHSNVSEKFWRPGRYLIVRYDDWRIANESTMNHVVLIDHAGSRGMDCRVIPIEDRMGGNAQLDAVRALAATRPLRRWELEAGVAYQTLYD